jgi:hypothetical protein
MKTLARERDKREIVVRLGRLRPDSPRRWGRMSPHQAVCHMIDAFRMGIGHRPVTHATGPLQRTMIKWIALYTPLSWPSGIRTSPEIDQEVGGSRPTEFAADVARLEETMQLFAAQPRTFEWPLHPIFGRLSHDAWLRWGYLHTDHHLRQFGA